MTAGPRELFKRALMRAGFTEEESEALLGQWLTLLRPELQHLLDTVAHATFQAVQEGQPLTSATALPFLAAGTDAVRFLPRRRGGARPLPAGQERGDGRPPRGAGRAGRRRRGRGGWPAGRGRPAEAQGAPDQHVRPDGQGAAQASAPDQQAPLGGQGAPVGAPVQQAGPDGQGAPPAAPAQQAQHSPPATAVGLKA